MVRVPDDVFDTILHGAIASLPDEFRAVLDHVPVVVDAFPGPEVFEQMEAAEELLGLFVGPPVEEWGAADAPPETSVIYLFQRNLEDACLTRGELAEQIRITLLHELGHCLGFDEDGLERLGLE